jgi:hypothetical protein
LLFGVPDTTNNPYDWKYLRQQFMLLNSTGTDINPARKEPCGPHVQPKPRPPAQWIDVIKGQAGGPLIEWGPHGIRVGPPPRPERRRSSGILEGLRSVLNERRKNKVKDVYMPFANEPLIIVSGISPSSLHYPNFKTGGDVKTSTLKKRSRQSAPK